MGNSLTVTGCAFTGNTATDGGDGREFVVR